MPDETPAGDAEAVARAERAIAVWAGGEELSPEDLSHAALAAEARPGVLDGSLERLSGIRRRALAVRLRELAAEAHPEHEELAELADRIDQLPDTLLVHGDLELLLLKHLVAEQPASEPELARALAGAEGIDEPAIAEWAADAADRGLIELAEPGSSLRRWAITEKGLRAIGVPPAR